MICVPYVVLTKSFKAACEEDFEDLSDVDWERMVDELTALEPLLPPVPQLPQAIHNPHRNYIRVQPQLLHTQCG